MIVYSATTEDIRVSVRPIYLDGPSDVMAKKFVFAYFIRIENLGNETVQLLRRQWNISHGDVRTEDVEGDGIVGKQPYIEAGDEHEYNSFCVLETMEGLMEGTYHMQREDGSTFRVVIPRFTLRAAAN
jgi:ApaG protein